MGKETWKDSKADETAENKTGIVQEQASKREKKVTQEVIYSLSEFAANARKIFGTRQECVVAALKVAGKTECSISDAKKIVEKFLKKEVK